MRLYRALVHGQNTRLRLQRQPYPSYSAPWPIVAGLAGSLVAGSRRSFERNARRATARLRCAVGLVGLHNIPRRVPCLFTCNHYSRPGFGAWWIALVVSGALVSVRDADVDREITWVMTEAWSYRDSPWRRTVLAPATRQLFRRVARVYGFIAMPPMPPDRGAMAPRARSVLRTVQLARDFRDREANWSFT